MKYDAGKPFAQHSLNHPMQSGFAVWFHECVGGIQPASPGFKKIKLKPYGYTQLEWAKAHYESPFGKITSDWKVDANTFQWTVTISPNTTAIVHVPTDKPEDVFEGMGPARNRNGVEAMGTKDGRALFQIGSGTYIFSSNLGT